MSQFQCGWPSSQTATDHCLGEPLPHQLANRARAPLRRIAALNPRKLIQGMLCGISPAFAGVFPIGGQIAHVLRTRAPCDDPRIAAETAHATCMC